MTSLSYSALSSQSMSSVSSTTVNSSKQRVETTLRAYRKNLENGARLRVLRDTATSILYALPEGKPMSTATCSLKTLAEESRTFVAQSGFKNNTSSYYSMRTITVPIGKNPSEELQENRRIEKLCSSHRKAITSYEQSLPNIFDQLENDTIKKVFTTITCDAAGQKAYACWKPVFEAGDVVEPGPALEPHVEAFFKQKEYFDFYNYAVYVKYKKRCDIDSELLRQLGVSAAAIFEEQMKMNPQQKEHNKATSWEKISPTDKNAFVSAYAYSAAYRANGLQKSTWTPFQSIDSLIAELKAKGPHVVGGIFGVSNYVKAAHKVTTIASHDIYGWSKGERNPNTAFGWTITILGASNDNNQPLVYYSDPIHSRTPNHKQKIYVISYDSLRNNVAAINEIWLGNRKASPNGYAWCAEKFEVVS